MDLRSVLLLASPLWLADVAAAQSACSGQPGLRALLPRDREIPLARSAPPPSVSEAADVWTLGADGYSLAVEGTSGAACFVYATGWNRWSPFATTPRARPPSCASR